MSRFSMVLNDGERDWYLLYSTVVDAPVSRGMTFEEYLDFYEKSNGEKLTPEEIEEKKDLFKKNGTDFQFEEVGSLLKCNRAGIDEQCANKEEILEYYCHNPDKYPMAVKSNDDLLN
jgi:hypothetical protein